MNFMKLILRKEQKNILNLLSIFFIMVFIIRFISEVSTGNLYSLDTDHEMYFGSRLLNGELIYIKELNDKLPLVQFIFAIPAFFKDIRIWIILSTLITIFSSLTLLKLIKQTLPKSFPKIEKSDIKLIPRFCACFYLFALSNLEGSLNTINPFASSCFLISMSLLLLNTNKNKNYNKKRILSAFFAAVAISFRPHYAPSGILLGIWISLRESYLIKNSSKQNKLYPNNFFVKKLLNDFSIWFAYTTSITFLINALPYIPNKIDYFIDGILHNSESLHSENLISIVKAQLFALPFGSITFLICSLTLLSSTIISFNFVKDYLFKNNKQANNLFKLDIFFGGFLCSLLLEITILDKHFWQHYFQLFIPFISFSLSILMPYLIEKRFIKLNYKSISKNTINFFIIFMVLVSSTEIKRSSSNLVKNINTNPRKNELKEIREFVNKRSINNIRPKFLHLTNMYIHWKLDESRQGLPHASNIAHIHDNKWKDLKRNYNFFVPKNSLEICSQINSSEIEIIFVDQKLKQINKCLNDDSKFSKDIDNKLNSEGVNIFIKKQ